MNISPTIDTPCHRTTLALPWLLNGSLDPVERRAVREHLIHCPSCRAELAQTRETLAAFTAAPAAQHQASPFQARRAAASGRVARRFAWAAAIVAALASLTSAWWLVRSGTTTVARQERPGAARIAAVAAPAPVAAAPAPAAQTAAPSPISTFATTAATPPAPVRIVARPARQRTPAASAPARLAEAVRGAEVTPQVIAAIDFENGAAGSPADRPARISEADFESGDLALKQTGLK